MSTHCTIKFVVRNHTDLLDKHPTVTEFRLLQYADGYEDYVRPRLDVALNEVQAFALPEEISAGTIASTYSMALDAEVDDAREDHGLPPRANSMTRPILREQMEAQAGRWQWLVEATVDQFTDAFEWRIIGGSDFT